MKIVKINKQKALLLLLVFVSILSWGSLIKTYGRYIYNELRDYYFASHSFYFNSDKLDVGFNNEELDNYSGVDPYTITINMNSYKNNFVASSSDIDYNITYKCSNNATCEVSKSSGIIYAASHTDSFYVTITPKENLSDGDKIWVEVEATSISPYKKTLKGKFTLKVGKMGLAYEINDVKNRAYFDVHFTNTYDFYTVNEAFANHNVGDRIDIETFLSLSNIDKEKCSSAVIEIKFDPRVAVLDMTNDAYINNISKTTRIINNYEYIDGFIFKVEALSSKSVRFYKSNVSNDYTYPFNNNNSIVDVIYH